MHDLCSRTSISSEMCGPDEIKFLKEVRHQDANKLYSDRADPKNTICKYCEQLVASSARSSSSSLEYLDHYSSILSFRQSADCCPLCRQLLEWIDKDTLSDCTELEHHGCHTTIQLMRPEEQGSAYAQSFRGISYWIFSVSTSKKFPMEREVWRPTLKHNASTGIYFIMAYDRGPGSLVHRPIWRNVENVSLESRIETVHEWLQQCETKHSGCRVQSILTQNRVLPSRILELTRGESMVEIALIKLCNVKGSFKYLALSHCWGEDGVSSCTTSENVIDREKRLAIGSLPQTFQDAVRIGRLLGYNFLWIDALCIVQDDEDDWEREAAKMASIFHCADVVLSAASARNPTEGCGIHHALEPAFCTLLHSTSDYNNDPQSRVSESPRMRLFMRRWSRAYTTLDPQPIDQRGWIFQEIFLARRVLYFVHGHMTWQCHHLLESEDGYLFKAENSSPIRSSHAGHISSHPLYNLKKSHQVSSGVPIWWDILIEFFQRKFTNPEDTLRSMAGLINLWKSHMDDAPILGMWEKDLQFHMCWFPEQSCSIRERLHGQPTWCWTSVPPRYRADIHHASDYASGADVIWQATIGLIDIQWKGQPFVSDLKHARLSLHQVRVTKGAFYQAMSYSLDNKEEEQLMEADAVELIPLIITEPTFSMDRGGARFHMHALLVKRVNLVDGEVRHLRKGYAEFVSWPDCSESDIDDKVDEITRGIEVIDIIELV